MSGDIGVDRQADRSPKTALCEKKKQEKSNISLDYFLNLQSSRSSRIPRTLEANLKLLNLYNISKSVRLTQRTRLVSFIH